MADQGKPFIGRTEELGLIEDTLVSLREGNPANLCLSGVPGSGKTSLIRAYLEQRAGAWHEEGVILCRLPVDEFDATAQDLAQGIVSRTCAGFLSAMGAEAQARRLCNPDTYPDEARVMRSLAVESFLDVFERFTHTTGAADEEVLRAALSFPERFALEKNLRFVLFADDFHLLQNVRFGKNGHAVDLFREALAAQSEAFWIVTVAPCVFTERHFVKEDGDFHRNFQFYPVEGLPREQAEELAASLSGAPPETAARLAAISTGVPLYLISMAEAARKAAGGAPPGEADVDRAFVSQALSSFGAINRHFERLITPPPASRDDVKAARAVLALLASGKRLGKDELARATNREGRALSEMLERILSSGFFRRVGNSYYFDDPVFRFWARKVSDPSASTGSFERLSATDSKKIVEEYVASLTGGDQAGLPAEEPDQPPAAAPGPGAQAAAAAPDRAQPAQKFNFRQLISKIKGKSLDGVLLGSAGAVRVPDFDRVQGFAFTSKDVKLYYLSGEDRGWVLLVVWRQRALGPEFVETLARRAAGRVDGLWFVSRGGFTGEAIALAGEKGVYCSSESDLKRIMEG